MLSCLKPRARKTPHHAGHCGHWGSFDFYGWTLKSEHLLKPPAGFASLSCPFQRELYRFWKSHSSFRDGNQQPNQQSNKTNSLLLDASSWTNIFVLQCAAACDLICPLGLLRICLNLLESSLQEETKKSPNSINGSMLLPATPKKREESGRNREYIQSLVDTVCLTLCLWHRLQQNKSIKNRITKKQPDRKNHQNKKQNQNLAFFSVFVAFLYVFVFILDFGVLCP